MSETPTPLEVARQVSANLTQYVGSATTLQTLAAEVIRLTAALTAAKALGREEGAGGSGDGMLEA